MKGVLFVHNHFPAQFRFVAEAVAKRGLPVAAVSGEGGAILEGVSLARWAQHRAPTPGIYPPALRSERDFLCGRAAAIAAGELKTRGFDPAVVVAHPGLGSSLFLKDVFPEARHIVHAEYYHRARGGDGDFDPEFGAAAFDDRIKYQAMNAPLALSYATADALVCPTPFQRDLLPPVFRERARVIHEGVDAEAARPDAEARFVLADGRVLDASRPVITYVSRRFEPLRGFHIFLRALPRLLEAVPEAEVLVIGSDDINGYGLKPPPGLTWKAFFLKQMEGRLDLSRVHFTGLAPHAAMIAAMQISAAHVYYTYPFVLSWSVLEAMACGALVIGSDTAPLRDAVVHGENGLLLDFFDVEALSEAMIEACRHPGRFAALRQAARRTVVEQFDRGTRCLPQWLALLDEALGATP
jgi:glycosyltransferase involved in cell wall biosynthesis